MANLTAKQALFVKEYLIDLNAKQAAIRSGYSEKSAAVVGCENLTKPNVQQEIQKHIIKRNESLEYSARDVLKRHIEIDNLDVADIVDKNDSLLPIREWPIEWRKSISGIDIQSIQKGDEQAVLSKIKWPDTLRNIELLGKHVTVQAYGANLLGLEDDEITEVIITRKSAARSSS